MLAKLIDISKLLVANGVIKVVQRLALPGPLANSCEGLPFCTNLWRVTYLVGSINCQCIYVGTALASFPRRNLLGASPLKRRSLLYFLLAKTKLIN